MAPEIRPAHAPGGRFRLKWRRGIHVDFRLVRKVPDFRDTHASDVSESFVGRGFTRQTILPRPAGWPLRPGGSEIDENYGLILRTDDPA